MDVSFACPSCGVKGTTRAVHIGRSVRCKHCDYHFTIPDPEAAEPDVYALDEPGHPVENLSAPARDEGAVFVPFQDRGAADRPRKAGPKRKPASKARQHSLHAASDFPWLAALPWSGAALTVVLGLIALLVPHGTWLAGCVLLGLGSLMVLVGHLAGAFGAFSEDFVYGVLYLTIPLYTAYYIVTRWEDPWIWFACATAGVGLVLLGTELVRWSGAAV
jgi:hypothetical protein